MLLHEALAQRVAQWHSARYPSGDFPAIAEVLEWSAYPDGSGFRLRRPQLLALETYWYLRLVMGTPHVLELYKTIYAQPDEMLEALLIFS